MTPQGTDFRLEFKYPVGVHQASSQPPLGLGLRRAYPDRTVCSLYFDSPGRRLYLESEEGLAIRSKLRLRSYADFAADHPLRVEVKRRDGRMGAKHLVELAGMPLTDAVRQTLQLTPVLQLDPDLRPLLFVRYRRSYFVTERLGRPLRLTWDRDIAFQRYRASLADHWVHRASLSVLEVKGPVADAPAVEALGRELPVRRSRFSKYALGVQRLGVA